MKIIELTIGTDTYPMATTLRVAYVLQGMNNHKPYLDIFQEIDKMTIEKQIEFLYAAYTVASTGETMSKSDFLNLCLDNLDLSEIMEGIKNIIKGITGKDIDKLSQQNAEDETTKN